MSLEQRISPDGTHQWFLDGRVLDITRARVGVCGDFTYKDGTSIAETRVSGHIAMGAETRVSGHIAMGAETDNKTIGDMVIERLRKVTLDILKLLSCVLFVIIAGCSWTVCWKVFLNILSRLVLFGLYNS